MHACQVILVRLVRGSSEARARDYDDLIVLAGNYGKTFSALSLGGIVAIAGIYAYKKRKQPK